MGFNGISFEYQWGDLPFSPSDQLEIHIIHELERGREKWIFLPLIKGGWQIPRQ